MLPHGQGSWDTRTVLSSIRRDDQGRLLLGSLGRVDNKPSWFVRSWADRIQSHYYPELGKVEWEMHWTGCIDFTPDHLMRLFEPAPEAAPEPAPRRKKAPAPAPEAPPPVPAQPPETPAWQPPVPGPDEPLPPTAPKS